MRHSPLQPIKKQVDKEKAQSSTVRCDALASVLVGGKYWGKKLTPRQVSSQALTDTAIRQVKPIEHPSYWPMVQAVSTA